MKLKELDIKSLKLDKKPDAFAIRVLHSYTWYKASTFEGVLQCVPLSYLNKEVDSHRWHNSGRKNHELVIELKDV